MNEMDDFTLSLLRGNGDISALLDRVIVGDATVLAAKIPDESVDMIFTDPPYPKEYLHLYGWLGRLARRVLKLGGYLFAYGSVEHMISEINLLHQSGLEYFWTIALLHHGGYPRMWYKKLMSGYKPIFVFTKGKPNRVRWMATVDADERDKTFHKWGQGMGFPKKIVEMLTDPGNIVLDPFCGGGNVLAACKVTGRHYIGYEIDPKVAEVAMKRLESLSVVENTTTENNASENNS